MLQCHSVSIYNRKEKKPKKAKTPNPVLLNCTTEYLKKGKCRCHLYHFRLTMLFSNAPFSKEWGFFKFENLHFHTIFGNSSYLHKLTKDFSELFSLSFELREFHGKHLVSENFDLNWLIFCFGH